ncbi:hypothetical protein P3L10_009408 [Capsicum annuum]
MLYAFLCQLSFSSSLPHLCRKDQAHALLQFKKTFTTNADASGCCQSYAKTLSWNRSIDCCSWDGVYCDETTGHVIKLDLSCIQHLKRLDLSFNDFSRSHISPKFGGLSNLTHLDLWGSSFIGQIPSEISYLSMLNVLRIWSEDPYMLTFGPHHYELLLKNLTQLRELEIYDVNISSTIPQNFSSYLTTIQLLNGQLCGTLPERIFHLPNLKLLELSYNSQLTPESMSYLTSLHDLNRSSGNLSGPILKPLWNLTNTENLSLENNNLEGTIYPFFKFGKLRGLRLRGNNFTGSIPSNFNNNLLSGTINTNQLSIIKFHGNKLEGKVPRSLINCNYLELLDLGLRSNKLHGPIKATKNKKLFAKLQIMDLSSNGFSGNLPASIFENFQAMKIIDENVRDPWYVGDQYGIIYHSVMTITTKGLDLEFARVLTTNIIINLSRNRFEGYIPSIIGDLSALCTLNLSHNRLEGLIPASLHQLSVLESLDLSFKKNWEGYHNNLHFSHQLEVPNLSHNHLIGWIPKGKQFDTFEKSSYQGNDGLHGFPLSKDCGDDDGVPQTITPVELDEEEEEDSPMISWQAVLMSYGCGLVSVLSIIYIILSTQTPAWF